MKSIRVLAIALLVAAGSAAARAEEPAAARAEGGVLLRFAWPDQMEASLAEKRQGRASAEVARRSLVRVERRGTETWVNVRPDASHDEPAGAEPQDEPELPTVAGPDGRFLRLDGLDAWVEQQGSPQGSSAGDKAEAATARRAAQESAARLSAEAREQWSYQVEAWIGRTVELGRTLESTGRIPISAVPGLEVEQRVALGARRWVSCALGGIDRRCLELTLRAEAGPEAFRKGLAASGGKAAKGFEDGSLTVEVLLVTDPETLLPWRYTLTKKLRLVFAGRGLSVDQVERREREYQWWKG